MKIDDYLIPIDDPAQAFFARRGFALVERGSVPDAVRSLPEFTHRCPQTHPCLRKLLDAGGAPGRHPHAV
jgi:N-acetylglutamate synthase-like GNAT family acetyltransferase